jgi:serine/threonine protein kinase
MADPCAPIDPAEAQDAYLGTTIAGKWSLDAVLGGGGAAIVYAATHRNGNRVAIKVMRPHLLGDPDLIARFTREGQIGNRVAHPGVVKAVDDGTTEAGAPYLVMELLDGESLGQRIARAREGGLAVIDAVRIADAVLDVLAAAHACGLVHRDIKPENVFLTSDGVVKLLDFGIAGQQTPDRRGETVMGTVLGTPAFMPPEQARGRWDEVDARSDVWAVGATLFVALTGRYLREGETPAEELLAAMGPVGPMSTVAPEIPPPLAAVLDRALAHAPADRFATAREMQASLRGAAAQGLGIPTDLRASPLRDRVPSHRVRPLLLLLLAAAGCAGIALAVVGRDARHEASVVPLPPSGDPSPPVDSTQIPTPTAAWIPDSPLPALVPTPSSPTTALHASQAPPQRRHPPAAASSRGYDPLGPRF